MGKSLEGKELGEGIYQTKSGKYRVRVRCRDGKRLTKNFESLVEARRWLVDARYDVEHNGLVAGSKMSVDKWFDYWINDIVGPRVKYNTIMAYKGRYKNRISPIIGDMQLCDVLPIHCQQVLNYAKSMDDSSGSIVKIRSIIGLLFGAALENRLIKSSPLTKSVRCGRIETPVRTILTYDEQRKFMEVGAKYAHFDEFVFILNTGLRCGEMSALKWKDIDWDAREIHVNGTMYYDKIRHCFAENSPKTKAGRRTIPLTNEAYNILVRARKKRMENPISLQYRDYVFVGKDGTPLQNYAYNKSLARIADLIGVKKLTMHSLRHTFATRCIEDGIKPNVLQKILGHSTITMTMDLYVHVTNEERNSEMQKLHIPTRRMA